MRVPPGHCNLKVTHTTLPTKHTVNANTLVLQKGAPNPVARVQPVFAQRKRTAPVHTPHRKWVCNHTQPTPLRASGRQTALAPKGRVPPISPG